MGSSVIPVNHNARDPIEVIANVSHVKCIRTADGVDVQVPIADFGNPASTPANITVANVTDRDALTNAAGVDQLQNNILVLVEDDGAGAPETYFVTDAQATWGTSTKIPLGSDNPATRDIKLEAASEAAARALRDALAPGTTAGTLTDRITVSLIVTGQTTAFEVWRIHSAVTDFDTSPKTLLYPVASSAPAIRTSSAVALALTSTNVIVFGDTGANNVLVQLPAANTLSDDWRLELWRYGANDFDVDPAGAELSDATAGGFSVDEDRAGVLVRKFDDNNFRTYKLGVQAIAQTPVAAGDFLI